MVDTTILDFGGSNLHVQSISTGYTKPGGTQGTTAQTFPGAVTVTGALTVTGNLVADAAFIGETQELSGAGAVDLTSVTTFITTGGADALTLADGTEGQVKILVMVADGGAGTLTPTNYGNGSTLTFDDVGDSAMLVFRTGNWWNVGTPTATVA